MGTTPKFAENHKISGFLRNVSSLEHNNGHTSHSLITILGKDVHLYPVMQNLNGFRKLIYGMAPIVSRSRVFHQKIQNFFFAQIDSEASETCNKSIFCENKCLKKMFNWLGQKGGSVLNNPCGFVPDR